MRRIKLLLILFATVFSAYCCHAQTATDSILTWAPAPAPDTTAYPADSVAGAAYTQDTSVGVIFGCDSAYVSGIFLGQPFTKISGPTVTSTNFANGNFYIDQDITIYGNCGFLNAVVVIASGKHIYVSPGAHFGIVQTHLFSCTGMWAGIYAQSTATSTGYITVERYSLIEDADTAIEVNYAGVTSGQTGLIANDLTVFNRNHVAIDIENCPGNLTLFSIAQCAFTSRDYSQYNTPGTSNYPFQWPDLDALTAYHAIPGAPFTPQMNIDYSAASLSGHPYPMMVCKDGAPASTGVRLFNVGSSSGSGLSITYKEITIGGNGKIVLFDNLATGIYAVNSNFISPGNNYIHMYARQYGNGSGIYAINNNITIPSQLKVVSQGAGGILPNLFYDCVYGVNATNYYDVTGTYSQIFSNHVYPGASSGLYGYWLQSPNYTNINISSNTITNITNGIVISANTYTPHTFPGSPSQNDGNINVNSNLVQAFPPNLTLPNQMYYVNQGIYIANAVQNIFPNTGVWGVSGYGMVHADGNAMTSVCNGIWISNFWMEPATSNGNTIQMQPTYDASGVQYGIRHTDCWSNTIFNNYVTGNTTSKTDDGCRAICLASTLYAYVGCNRTDQTGRAFEFYGANNNAQWLNNAMGTHSKGLVLNNNGVISQQGAVGNPINDAWTGTYWSTTHYMTYNYLSPPSGSKLYVHSGSTTDPSNIYNNGNPLGDAYSNGSTIVTTATSSTITATPCPAVIVHTGGITTALEPVAQDAIPYDSYAAESNWMSQYTLWQNMAADTTMADSSAILHDFQAVTQNSRYAWLTGIENDVATGDFTDAAMLLGYNSDSLGRDTASSSGVLVGDDTLERTIVCNYKKFYRLYMGYMDSTLAGTDTTEIAVLANLCPATNGAVVYQARALYTLVYNTITIFNDDSTCIADSGELRRVNPGSTVTTANAGQQYSLYPVPAKSNLILTQAVADNNAVFASIIDASGRLIKKQVLFFNQKTAALKLPEMVAGLYLLQLTDSNGRNFSLKFLVQ